jgi:hypothetical protein
VKEPLVLEFGPRDLRKEAAFCGADCLQYFIKHMLILKEAPLKKVKKRSKKKKKGFFEALFSL